MTHDGEAGAAGVVDARGAAGDRWPTLADLHEQAQGRLPRALYDYAAGGSGEEATLRANRDAFERVWLRPRVLRDVQRRSTATTFLGIPLALPVLLAPVGSVALFDDDGALACARAAHAAGTTYFVPAVSRPALDVVAAETDGPLLFQLYVRGDRGWVGEVVDRVAEAGYLGLCVTVDMDVDARRERDLRNRFSRRTLHGPAPNVPDAPGDDLHQQRWTWDDVAWLRGRTQLPLLLKGTLTREDAVLALGHGMDALYVSNHGGRALDYAPATLDALPRILDAVGGEIEVLVDGGVAHGVDVAKALALGATAVLVGKLQCWGLAAGGQAGLERVLDLLREELSIVMGLLGVTDVAQLDRSCLAPARPPLER